ALPDPKACDRVAARASGRVVRRNYDERNRLDSLTFPDGLGNQQWTYTPDGLPSQIATRNGDGAEVVYNHYSYNRRRLLTSERVVHPDGYDGSISYGYSANGH